MKRYIITGTPGSGKTTILGALKNAGYPVVSEAATDVISREQALGNPEPWRSPQFIDQIVELQLLRQLESDYKQDGIHFFDRSPFCTHALAKYLQYDPSSLLKKELDRVIRNGVYEKRVFFLNNLGFVTPTEARRITFEEALTFEAIHRESYEEFGFECMNIPAVSVDLRMDLILGAICS